LPRRTLKHAVAGNQRACYNRPAMPRFTKHTVILQSQAQYCMEKEHVSLKEVLETMNDGDGGETACTNPREANRLAAYPEVEDEERIPTLKTDEKDYPKRRISVTYSTSFKTHNGRTIKYATIHWASVGDPLSKYFSINEPAQEINREKCAEWLQPRERAG
jgi:hypothetical protein